MNAQSLRLLYLLVFAVAFVWERLLMILNGYTLHSNRKRIPSALADSLDLPTYQRSVTYGLSRLRFGFVSSTVTTVLLLVFLLNGWLGALDQWLYSLPLGNYSRGVIFVYLVSALTGLLDLPFSLYSQFVIEQRFGFNRMTFKLYFLDQLKSLGLSLLIFTPLLLALFWFVDRSGELWWVWSFLVFIVVQLGISFLYPTVIAPLFNRFTPLDEGSLKEKITALAQRLNFSVRGFFVMDGSRRSKHSNAYFTGFGRTKRVILFDTLLKVLTENQIIAVLAHEIGHQKKRHVLKGMLVAAVLTLLGLWLISLLLNWGTFFEAFYFSGPSTSAALILFVFFSGPLSFLFKPLFSGWSRRHEYQADHFAAQALGSGRYLQEALLGLSRDNLSNVTPHRLYSFVHYSHPTLLERVAALEDF